MANMMTVLRTLHKLGFSRVDYAPGEYELEGITGYEALETEDAEKAEELDGLLETVIFKYELATDRTPANNGDGWNTPIEASEEKASALLLSVWCPIFGKWRQWISPASPEAFAV